MIKHTLRDSSRLVAGIVIAGTSLVSACRTTPASAPAAPPTPAVASAPVQSTQRPASPAPNPNDSTRKPAVPQQAGRPPVPVARPGQPAQAGPKPYAQVITKEAVTKHGLFTTHQIGSKLFFEIPRSQLDKDLLVVGRYVKVRATNPNTGPFAGDQFGKKVIRFEKREHSLLMRTPSYNLFADSGSSVARAVESSALAPIAGTLAIAAYGHDSSVIVDVTPLFTTVPDFSSLGAARLDAARSFVDRVATFPENVNVEATQTGTIQNGVATAVGLWSIIRLPEEPMMPRLMDARVGYFSVNRIDFSTSEHRAVNKRFITRWRLEKKDPNAELSEPVKPIIYYIDPATPDQWKPFVRDAIEAWQVAFEAAGFKNAIIAREAPANDPDWSLEDIRHTVVRWLPSTTENAQGPHINDPRTGEILNGSIRMFHNILNLQRAWYFTQVGPLDKRAQTFPFPDSLMGRLLQYVVEHEIGHTLGFPHNHKASSTYPLDSLRSRTWLEKMGHVPSLMDYARFNYVVQPEDNIPPHLLIPKVGPYDKFAAMWGYKPIPGAKTPEDELPTLDQWARMQDSIPWYRFGRGAETGYAGNPDYGDAREAIGDADAVRASTLGLKNIKRVVPLLSKTAIQSGQDYSDLSEMYDRLLRQWQMEMGHVVNIIGGTETQTKFGGQAGPVYTPVSRARQVEAMKFLTDNVFTTPDYLIDPQISSLVHPEGGAAKVLNAQVGILRTLISDNAKINRMVSFQAAASNPADVYSVSEMLYDLRQSIWSELGNSSNVKIDVQRRGLQRNMIALYNRILNPPPPPAQPSQPGRPAAPPPPPPPGELVAGVRAELSDLREEVKSALHKVNDRETRAHLLDAEYRIDNALNPK